MTADGKEILRQVVTTSKDFPLYYWTNSWDDDFHVMKRAKRGGDRTIAKCYSHRTAYMIVTALNIYDVILKMLREG